MAGVHQRGSESGARRSNPLWLVDALGVLGLGALVWALTFAASGPYAEFQPIAREFGLALTTLALGVRAVDLMARRRHSRDSARRELLRRLSLLDEALMDLRRTAGRETARRFEERRRDYEAALPLTNRWMDRADVELAERCAAFCRRMGSTLVETVATRNDVANFAYALRRDIERAAERGYLEYPDADNLLALMQDGLSVLDEALYAEFNADHFGRLSGAHRAFIREIERYYSDAADRIEREGAVLFERLLAQVSRKIEIADMLHDWEDDRARLEARLAGLSEPPARPRPPRQARLVERFVMTPRLGPPAREAPLPRRLPAAND